MLLSGFDTVDADWFSQLDDARADEQVWIARLTPEATSRAFDVEGADRLYSTGSLRVLGGLNGETDMRDWIDQRVAPRSTFNLVAEEQEFRRATLESLRRMGAAESLTLFDLVDEAET